MVLVREVAEIVDPGRVVKLSERVDHRVRGGEAVLDAHRLLGGGTPQVLVAGRGAVGVQQRTDRGDRCPSVARSSG